MRVGFVNHSFIELPEGDRSLCSNSIGLWCYQMATRIADRCEEIVVYHQKRGVREGELQVHRGVEFQSYSVLQDERVHQWGVRFRKVLGRFGWRPDPRKAAFARPGHYRGYCGAVAADVARRQLDVVHVSNYFNFVPAIRRQNPGVKIHLHMQCDWLVQLDHELIEWCLRDCDGITGCTDYVTQGIAERFPGHAHKCATQYNAVDTDAFQPAAAGGEKPGHILFVGRLSPEKGLHTLLEAMNTVFSDHPETRLTIVGGRVQVPYEFVVAISDDPLVREMAKFYGDSPFVYEQALHAMVPAGRRDQVRFVDHIPQDQLKDLYASADVFVFPSEWHEPFGMPVIEAMANGVPVVTTQSGGIPEFMPHEEAGLVVPRADSPALAAAISRLLGDADLRARMGEVGREAVVASFRWDQKAEELASSFQKLLR